MFRQKMEKVEQWNNNKGISLVEIIMTTFILTTGIAGVLLFFSTAAQTKDIARNITTATTHVEYIFEEMRSMATLAEITSTDWVTYAQNNNLNTLNNESVSVTFTDPSADPLEVTTQISWLQQGRAYNVNLTTKFTK